MRRATAAGLAALMMVATVAAAWPDGYQRVTGNTVDTTAGENGSTGWWFNRDATTSSPYEFTFDEASIGYGSLYVLPIDNLAEDGVTSDTKDKFIAELFAFAPVDELTSISYDFRIAGNGTESDSNEFYLNVYTNGPESEPDKFYDCRFDYVPSTGSTTDWETATFASTDIATKVTQRNTSTVDPCPATLAGMPEGSTVRALSLSVGDTSLNDTGLAGYYDNVVVTTTSGSATFDFEVPLQVKDACKQGGYELYGFDNQGECVSSLQANTNAGKGSE